MTAKGCKLVFSFIFLTSLNVKVSVFFCSNGRYDPSQQGFGSVLLKALLDNMPLLPAAATGGTYAVFVVVNIHYTCVVC